MFAFTQALGTDSELGHLRRAKKPMGAPQLFQHGDEHDACEAAESLLDAALEELRACCRAALLVRLSTPSLQHLTSICAEPQCQGMLPPLLLSQCAAESVNSSVSPSNNLSELVAAELLIPEDYPAIFCSSRLSRIGRTRDACAGRTETWLGWYAWPKYDQIF